MADNDLPPDREDKLARIQEIKDEMSTLEAEYDELREEVIVPFEGMAYVVGKDGHKYRVTKTQTSTPVYDMSVLERLDPEVVAEITEVKISGARLQAALRGNRLDPMDAVDLVSYKPKKPFLNFNLAE